MADEVAVEAAFDEAATAITDADAAITAAVDQVSGVETPIAVVAVAKAIQALNLRLDLVVRGGLPR